MLISFQMSANQVSRISKFNIPKKIESSIAILDGIIRMSAVKFSETLNVESIILTDIDLYDEVNAEEFIEFTILYLSDETLSPDYIIQYQIVNLLDSQFDIDNKPYLMTCSQRKEYLSDTGLDYKEYSLKSFINKS